MKYRWAKINAAKNDQGLWSLVWLLVAFLLILSGPKSIAQPKPSTKSNAPFVDTLGTDKPKPKLVESEKEAAAVDDNGDDEDDSDEDAPATAIVEENPPSEILDTEKTAAQDEEKLADDEEEVSEPPQEDVAQEPEPKKEPEAEAAPAPVPVAEPTPTPEPLPIRPTEEIPREKVSSADMVDVIPKEKNVEVELRKKYTNYRERRTTHGFLFNINAENLYFPDYMSIIDGELYESMFGQEDVTLVQVQVGYKLNFFLGSLTAGAGFGQGTLIDDRLIVSTGNVERELTIQKKSIHAQWMLDALLKEPYFVPYVGMSYWQLSLSEKGVSALAEDGGQTVSFSKDTGNGTALTVGFLVQLNWLEPETARIGYMAQGLENTYLDVFWTQYQNTDNELDPAFENDFNFGVGLRLEF